MASDSAPLPACKPRSVWLVLVVALVARLVWLVLCPNQPVSDQGIYHNAALEIAQGHGFLDERGQPLGWWPVGYPALLGATYATFGAAVFVGHALNVVLGVGTVLALFGLARRLFGTTVAWWAALIASLHPTLVLYTTVLATEHPFELGAVLAVALMTRCFGAGRGFGWAIVTGLVLGALTYVRPTALVLLPVALVFAWPERKALGATVARLATIGVVTFAVLVPWGVRNQNAFGVFSLTSLNAGSNLWMGNHVGSDGCYTELPAWTANAPLVERENRLRDEAVQYIKSDPRAYGKRCLRRTVTTLRSDTIAVVWNENGIAARLGTWAVGPLKGLCTGVHALLYAAALLGMAWRLVRGRLTRSDVAVVATLAMLAVPFVFIVGGNRYHLPLIPFVILAAVAAWRRDQAIS